MPLPPQLDPAQRQAALEKAAAARRQRAELKEKLKAGSLSLEELLAQGDTDDAVAKLKVVTVLESLPGVGGQGPPHHGRAGDQREPSRPGPRDAPAPSAARHFER